MEPSDSILDLYSRIPDYSEVKHLGNSDFINTLERLKEEFRKCRNSINEIDSDVEYITEKTSKILNIDKSGDDVPTRDHHQPYYSSGGFTQSASWSTYGGDRGSGLQVTVGRNVNIVGPQHGLPNSSRFPGVYSGISQFQVSPAAPCLSIKSCCVYKNPAESLTTRAINKTDRFKLPARFESSYADDYDLCSERDSVSSGGGGSGMSKWSSSPEIYKPDKEWIPPSNIEKRLLSRKSQNNSAPSIPDMESKPSHFKANPVPSHVHKPLYDFIVLKNKRRSIRVREKSKQKLLAQVKPFSFSNDSKAAQRHVSSHGQMIERGEELLKSGRSGKSKRNSANSVKFSSEMKFGTAANQFRAHPAPPRTKALLAAIKLKEQQDYRELRKRLRSEALMKTSSLPPSMEARRRQSSCSAASFRPCHRSRLDNMLQRYDQPGSLSRDPRSWRATSDDTLTDDDPYITDSDEAFIKKTRGSGLKYDKPLIEIGHDAVKKSKKKTNFTPYGELKFPLSSASSGIFEATSNDNHASRLRVQATKARELSRIRKEEDELMRAMKIDKKRQKLRDAHYLAWRRAGSYSSAQDIAMRRQLRMAAAILERESYKKDMVSMLTRVRSAPLLLEGVREKRAEPCRRHKEEGGSGNKASKNKLSSPRHFSQQYFNANKAKWGLGREDTEKSETAALAEGSLTNSDNESQQNYALELDPEDEENNDHDERNDEDNDQRHALKSGNGSNGKHKISTPPFDDAVGNNDPSDDENNPYADFEDEMEEND